MALTNGSPGFAGRFKWVLAVLAGRMAYKIGLPSTGYLTVSIRIKYSRSAPISFWIFDMSPAPMVSPECTGTTVPRPSGCFSITWLLLRLAILNPYLRKAWIT